MRSAIATRFNGVAGAARAAERAGEQAEARNHYGDLLALAKDRDRTRPEVAEARAYLTR